MDWRYHKRQHRRWAWFYIVLASAWILWAAFCRPTHAAEVLTWVDSCDKCDLDSPVEAYRLAASYRAKVYRFGLQADSLFWPQGQRLVIRLKNGSQVSSLVVLGVGPMDMHGRPIRLGIASRWLRQDDLEQGHRGRGGLILAAFPDSALTAKVVGVTFGR